MKTLSPATVQRRKNLRNLLLLFLGGVVFAFVAGGIAGYFDGSSEAANGTTPVADLLMGTNLGYWLLVGFGFIACLVSMWGAANWYFSIDEAAQRAHLEAWYWGASWALILPTPFILASLFVDAATWDYLENLNLTATQMAGVGAAMLYGLLIAGYGVAWLVWWWRRR
jgi:hypothetical protein